MRSPSSEPRSQDPATPSFEEMSEAIPVDRSYAAAVGWALGLLVFGVLFFVMRDTEAPEAVAASNETVAAPTAIVSNDKESIPLSTGPFSKAGPSVNHLVRIIPRPAESTVEGRTESRLYYIKNDSDRTVLSWTATVEYQNAQNLRVAAERVTSTDPIPPHSTRSFAIQRDLNRFPQGRMRFVLGQVRYKQDLQ